MNKYLGIAIIVIGGISMGGGLGRAIDLLSLIFVLGVAIGHTLGAKEEENTLTRFGDGCIRGGWLGLLVGVTLITGTEYAAQMDFTTLLINIFIYLVC